MRLHHLTVSAFGPFAGTESVDFEELNDAGLFLLTGPTGAGKSSLLDAVCFALYGTVPGVRGVKTLKSQHAPVDAPPEVVLDFSVRDRRFVVRRTPEWSRPKRRGEGLLTEKASASLTETTGGDEHFLTSRAAEVGLLVGDLMGMNAAQFVQVALLPQGEFQTFLRASSQERHDVLQHLFRTDRFARIEDWVHEHSRELTDRSGREESGVQRLVDSIAERSALDTPDHLSHGQLAQSAADGLVLPWAHERLGEAAGAAAEAGALLEPARERLALAVSRHTEVLRAQEQAERRASARAALVSLEDSEPEAAAGLAALEAAERAARCLPLLKVLDRAASEADAAAERRRAALRGLGGAGLATPDPSAADLADLVAITQVRATRLETLLPREGAARAATEALVDAHDRLAAAQRELATSTARAAEIPGELERLATAVQAATERAGRRDLSAVSLTAAQERLAAAEAVVTATAEVATLAEEHRDARDRGLAARERRAELAERRLAGMAAELAGQLAEGAACQVCGSTSHPRPARTAADAVTDADQREAERLVTRTAEALEESTRALQRAEHRRDTFDLARDGRTATQARSEVDALCATLADADRAAAEWDALRLELDAVRAEQGSLADRQAAAAVTIAGLRQTVAGLEETRTAVSAELAAAGAEDGRPLRTTVVELRSLLDALERAGRVVETAETMAARAAEHESQAVDAVAEQGFGSLAEARAAVLGETDRMRLRDLLDERARAAARAQSVLDETDPDEPTDTGSLAESAVAVEAAELVAAESARLVHLAQARVEAVDSLVGRLESAVEAWAPLRDDSLRAESMSKLVRGMGHDNQLQMRLSAYVLATRLDQVVAAANERLAEMRDQRYLLQRTDRAARRGAQAGLGLEIVDQWTGDARDPATLSGGETFVVSLSLALGLADVVTQEAGGTEIETLFVDEGFGTLDADTLDDVMDRLDGLRAGGRTVGVVSHVSELRNRIPTQVHVDKGRSGSSISVTTLVG